MPAKPSPASTKHGADKLKIQGVVIGVLRSYA